MIDAILPITIAIIFIYLIGKIIDEYFKKIPLLPRKDSDGRLYEKMKEALDVPAEKQNFKKYLGFGERVLFFIAFNSAQYLIIGFWLSFKLASKWQTWSSVIKMPEDFNPKEGSKEDLNSKEASGKEWVNPFEVLNIRNRFGTNLLNRWLIRTLANLLIGYGAFVVADFTRSLLACFFPDPFFINLIYFDCSFSLFFYV